jgi:hypothetical protein
MKAIKALLLCTALILGSCTNIHLGITQGVANQLLVTELPTIESYLAGNTLPNV